MTLQICHSICLSAEHAFRQRDVTFTALSEGIHGFTASISNQDDFLSGRVSGCGHTADVAVLDGLNQASVNQKRVSCIGDIAARLQMATNRTRLLLELKLRVCWQ